MANGSKKEGYTPGSDAPERIHKVLGLGLVSAASAIAGGLAVAWWYRKTLTKLQNPILQSGAREKASPEPAEGNLEQANPDSFPKRAAS